MTQKEGAQDESKTGEQASSMVNKYLFLERKIRAFGMCIHVSMYKIEIYTHTHT